MKAITRSQYGGPEVLHIKEVADLSPRKDEVKVKVHATTVNRTDCSALTGKPYLVRTFIGMITPTAIPGTDFAGEVVEVGDEVTNFKVGDRVWGFDDQGLQSYANFMCIKEKKGIAKIPDNYSYEQAAASAEGAHYAFNGLKNLSLEAGYKVVVNGGSGAIGSATIQLLKYLDVYVTAVANTKNLELMKNLGADKVYNYESEDFTKDTERYHYVLDTVGKSHFGACKPLLLPGGIYTSSELGPRAENLYLPFFTYFSSKKVKFPIPTNCRRSILYLTRLINEGKFEAVIDRSYDPKDIADAYTYVSSGQKTGNVILNMAQL